MLCRFYIGFVYGFIQVFEQICICFADLFFPYRFCIESLSCVSSRLFYRVLCRSCVVCCISVFIDFVPSLNVLLTGFCIVCFA